MLLFFYPLDFTFVCPTEIIAYSEKASEFRALGCEVIGCSVVGFVIAPRVVSCLLSDADITRTLILLGR